MARGYPDYEGDKQAIYLAPEWATKEGFERAFYQQSLNVAPLGGNILAYAVPAGVTLYLTQFGFLSRATLVADRDNNQMTDIFILDFTAVATLVVMGGNGGGFGMLPSYSKIPGGHNLQIQVHNFANHNCDLWLFAAGYEV